LSDSCYCLLACLLVVLANVSMHWVSTIKVSKVKHNHSLYRLPVFSFFYSQKLHKLRRMLYSDWKEASQVTDPTKVLIADSSSSKVRLFYPFISVSIFFFLPFSFFAFLLLSLCFPFLSLYPSGAKLYTARYCYKILSVWVYRVVSYSQMVLYLYTWVANVYYQNLLPEWTAPTRCFTIHFCIACWNKSPIHLLPLPVM